MENHQSPDTDPAYLLSEAIAKADDFVQAAPPGNPMASRLRLFLDPDRPLIDKYRMYFTHLMVNYGKTRDDALLDRAITIAPNMLDWPGPQGAESPESAEELADGFSVLSVALLCRYQCQSRPIDLDLAIALRKASITARRNKSSMSSIIDDYQLGSLFVAQCRQRSRETINDYSILRAAIAKSRSALRKLVNMLFSPLPPDFPVHLSLVLSNIATAHELRYSYFKNSEDIEKGVRFARLALGIGKASGLPALQCTIQKHNLAGCILAMAKITPNPELLLDEAVALSADALEATPHTNKDFCTRKRDLAVSYLERFTHFGDIKNFEHGVNNLKTLLNGSFDMPGFGIIEKSNSRSKLAAAYLLHYDKTQELSSIDASISFAQEALRGVENGEAALTCAIALCERHRRTGTGEHLTAAVQQIKDLTSPSTSMSRTVPMDVRYHTACYAARLCQANGRYEDAISFFSTALDILPSILFFGREYREENLSDGGAGDLGLDGAACCIALGRTDQAVEMLEHGRSIGWRRNLQMRMRFDELQRDHPQKARRLRQIGWLMEKFGIGHQTKAQSDNAEGHEARNSVPLRELMVSESAGSISLGLTEQWDVLLAEIRTLNGYEDFLRPLKFQRLQPVARNGPVVVVNVSGYRCDALIITSKTVDKPLLVELERQVFAETKALSVELLRGFEKVKIYYEESSEGESGEEEGISAEEFGQALVRVLAYLQQKIVEPVLAKLQEHMPDGPMRRIWWCPTGSLTFLPIHYVTMPIGEMELIPSYTTSLGAMIRAQEVHSSPTHPRLLALGAVLPSIIKEMNTIKQIVPSSSLSILKDEAATVSSVLDAMETHQWVHFACHGAQDEVPYRSCLFLQDGELSAAQLAAQRLPDAQFACLFACETSTGIPRLCDESMHLAATLQFVGFRATAATMWGVEDNISSLVVEGFYRRLFNESKTGERGWPDVTSTASALHEAIGTLKSALGASLSRGEVAMLLAPFIHMGL